MKEYNYNPDRSNFVNPITPPHGYHTKRQNKQLLLNDSPYFNVKNWDKNQTVYQERTPFQTASSLHMTASAHPVLQYREQCYRQMEISLQSQNSNLKEHNNFLVTQVRDMYEREKTLKKILKSTNDKLENMTLLNQHLQVQIHKSTTYTITQINKMQDKIAKDSQLFEDELRMDPIQKCKNQGIGWDTECSLSQNLQSMKRKVYQFYNKQAALDFNKINNIQKPQKRQKYVHNKNIILDRSGYKINDKTQSIPSSPVHQNVSNFSPKNPFQKLKSSGWKKYSNHQQTP